jgi:hypothetical protein
MTIYSVDSLKHSNRYLVCGHKNGTIEMKMFKHCAEIFGGVSIKDCEKNRKQLFKIMQCHSIDIDIFKRDKYE